MSAVPSSEPVDHVSSFMTIRKYIQCLKNGRFSADQENKTIIEHGQGFSTRLVKALQDLWTPFCVKGKVILEEVEDDEEDEDEDEEQGSENFLCIFKNSTFRKLDVPELIAHAKQSPFGHGTETVTDTTVRNSFEIAASELEPRRVDAFAQQYLMNFRQLCPQNHNLELRPYKLVIYKEGGHFHEHRDTVRGEGHIGTLVVILNSEYTGGELEVTHNGRTESVTGAYSWVAMYGDCLHKINPVTSGTRVSLIYDIYARGGSARGEQEKEKGEESDGQEENEVDEVDAENAENEEEDEDEEENAEDDERDFWSYQSNSKQSDAVREATATIKKNIVTEVAKEVKKVDNLIITLQHLYPECQTSPAFLKGGDRALYNLLSEHFDVQVVAATIYRCYDEQNSYGNCLRCEMFSSSIMAQALVNGPKPYVYTPPNKKQKTEPKTTKVVIPLGLHRESVLDYSPYIEYTGNESQSEEGVYIVAGLQVRMKE